MAPGMGRAPFLLITVAVFLAYFTGTSQLVEAKRGCSAFGHSCFGGHGKRADLPSSVGSSAIPSEQQASQEVLIGTADDVRAAFPEQDAPSFEFTPQRYVAWSKVQPFLRQWLESYRRTSEGLETK